MFKKRPEGHEGILCIEDYWGCREFAKPRPKVLGVFGGDGQQSSPQESDLGFADEHVEEGIQIAGLVRFCGRFDPLEERVCHRKFLVRILRLIPYGGHVVQEPGGAASEQKREPHILERLSFQQ